MSFPLSSFLPLPPPQFVPVTPAARAHATESLLAALACYVRYATGQSHADAAAALQGLHDALPAADAATAAPRAALTYASVADDAAHDHYFHVARAAPSDRNAFLRGIIIAAILFHSEMASAYDETDALRFAPVGSGLNALLGRIAGVQTSPVHCTEVVSPAVRPALDPMRRWVLGHQIFAALSQGIIFALHDFELEFERGNAQGVDGAIELAADLLEASAHSFRFTSDFLPSDYSDVVRPSMMAEHVGTGFSGLLSIDHRQLVAVMVRVRPLMGETLRRHSGAHERLTRALNHVYDEHKFVCARFDGAKKPSLRCPNSSPLPGTEQLERYQGARVRLLRPGSGVDPVIL